DHPLEQLVLQFIHVLFGDLFDHEHDIVLTSPLRFVKERRMARNNCRDTSLLYVSKGCPFAASMRPPASALPPARPMATPAQVTVERTSAHTPSSTSTHKLEKIRASMPTRT